MAVLTVSLSDVLACKPDVVVDIVELALGNIPAKEDGTLPPLLLPLPPLPLPPAPVPVEGE